MSSRPHHYFFAHRYLPGMFQSEPGQFMSMLASNGLPFVHFMWDRAGQQMPPDDRLAPDGLALSMHKSVQNIEVAIISLPKPENTPEAHFVAPAYHPEVNGQLFTRYYTLEFTLLGSNQPGTMFCRWSDTTHMNMGDGPRPDLNEFLNKIEERLTADLAEPKS